MSQRQLPMPEAECRLDKACLDAYGSVHYLPNLFGNYLFLGIFAAVMLGQIGLGIRYKTWGYLAAISGGTILEIVGYYGRIQMNIKPFNGNNFIIYLVGLTIGPAFYSAAIYLAISRVITIFGSTLSWFKPRTVTISFVSFDIVSLLLQSAGGAIASMADEGDKKMSDMGVNIMIAGLVAQVVATSLFVGLCVQLSMAIRRHPEKLDYNYASYRKALKFKLFLWAIGISVFAILIRCVFRCAELLGGFNSELANNETLFMLLDGSLMVITAMLLTAFHPGWTLGEYWHTATFSLRGKKASTAEKAKFLPTGSEDNSQIDLRQSTRYESLPGEGNQSQIPLTTYQQGGRYEPYRGQNA